MTTAKSLPVVLLAMALASSCTKTVVETKEVDVHDTVFGGPAWIRFTSMVPDAPSVTLRSDSSGGGSTFAAASATTSPSYSPVAPMTSVTIYADYRGTSGQHLDPVTIPGILQAGSMHTIVLFQTENSGQFGTAVWTMSDSMKLVPAPEGKCYIRFLNGLSDYPTNPELYLDLDSLNHSIFTIGDKPLPVSYGEPVNYVAIPAGVHRIIAASDNGEEVESVWQTLQAGHYYTARVTGRKTMGTDRLFVDPE